MLGIGLAVVISLTSRALASQTDGEKTMVAAWLADELLATVVVEGPTEYSKRNLMSGAFESPFDDFAFDLTINELGAGLPFEVSADVWWPANKRTTGIRVQTLIAPRLNDPDHPREPREWIDRDARYFEEEFEE